MELFLRLVLVLANPLAFLDKLLSWTGDNLLIFDGGESCERVLWNLRLVSRRQHLSSFSILASFLPKRKRTWKKIVHLDSIYFCLEFQNWKIVFSTTILIHVEFYTLNGSVQSPSLLYYSESSSKVVYYLAKTFWRCSSN